MLATLTIPTLQDHPSDFEHYSRNTRPQWHAVASPICIAQNVSYCD
jgi:hypothetical protein